VLINNGTVDPEAIAALAPSDLPLLLAQLGEDGLPGTLAAWALGQLASENDLRRVIPDGRIDVRQNGYQALAILAARGAASNSLAAWLVERIDAEIAKAKNGGTGLAEQAARPLAILGHPDFAAIVQRIIEGDRFCDRFELDRLRSAVNDNGRDRVLAKDLTAPWEIQFADHLPKAAAPAPAPVEPPAQTAAKPVGKGPKPPPMLAPMPPVGGPTDAELTEDELAAAEAAATADLGEDGEVKPQPVDWAAFETSPEFTSLPTQAQGLVKQLGPLLEKLAAQAIRALLTDLQGQEFAALLLQVLPQALQPQAVQMALHPHALNGYQALAKFLHRTGAATQGDSLLQGVKLVRTQLRDQMRKSGMLGGPDYTDPDEIAASTPAP
jgi:hypothetical protein